MYKELNSQYVPKELLFKVNSWRKNGQHLLLTNIESRRIIKHNTARVSNGCWLWKLKCDKEGYGRLPNRLRCAMGLQTQRAHSAVLILWHGKPVHGRQACHTCDVPTCCNPKHIQAGTQQQNIQASIHRGRRPKHLTKEHRANISISHMGVPLSSMHKARLSEVRRGKLRSKLSNAKTSATLLAYHAAKRAGILKVALARRTPPAASTQPG